MHIAASPVWDAWSELSTRLPADLDLDELARTSQAILRHRDNGVSDGASLLRLSLARGPGGKSLQDTAVWARLNGVAELTGQSLNERLHRWHSWPPSRIGCWRDNRRADRCCGLGAACASPMAAA